MKTETSLVIDCGGYTVKTGISRLDEPKVYLNAITKAKSEKRRLFVSNQLDECRDASGLFYMIPFQKGYLVNWDIQKTIWDYIYGKEELNFDFANQKVVLTEPYFNFQPIQEGLAEVFFEDLECEALYKTNPGTLSCHKYMKEHPGEACCLVVDSGYSFTHIIPHVHGKPVKSKTIRVDVGGKLLTNHLKDTISYRQLNVMDETYVVNQIKEDICFVSQNLAKDFEIAKKRGDENTIALDYVLPDFTTLKRGKIKEKTEESIEGEQTLRLTNERFTVPEVLFHPSDLGIPQMGISEAIVHTIESCPPELHSHLFKNIVLTGGNCVIPGFRDRVETDVRFMAPSIMEVGVVVPSNPITYAWHGGAAFSKEPGSSKFFVTRKEYDEHGYNIFEDKYSK